MAKVPSVPAPTAPLPLAATKLPVPPPRPTVGDRTAAASPRKETARIGATPDSPMKATVRLGTTQPLNIPPVGAIRTMPAPVAPVPPVALVESVPATFCWALLGVSALILLIQLWTYFS
ncbi:MAG: hypothetical protein ACR2MW_09915 [Chthoniobacterales bacterium]